MKITLVNMARRGAELTKELMVSRRIETKRMNKRSR
jgi:hypothetical protein